MGERAYLSYPMPKDSELVFRAMSPDEFAAEARKLGWKESTVEHLSRPPYPARAFRMGKWLVKLGDLHHAIR